MCWVTTQSTIIITIKPTTTFTTFHSASMMCCDIYLRAYNTSPPPTPPHGITQIILRAHQAMSFHHHPKIKSSEVTFPLSINFILSLSYLVTRNASTHHTRKNKTKHRQTNRLMPCTPWFWSHVLNEFCKVPALHFLLLFLMQYSLFHDILCSITIFISHTYTIESLFFWNNTHISLSPLILLLLMLQF